MNTATRRRRLTRLADHLENLPKKVKFNMATWGWHQGKHEPEENNYCGTAACALGHAAMIPAFRRAGLTMTWQQRWLGEEDRLKGVEPWFDAHVEYEGNNGEHAGQYFFGLTDAEACDVFLGTSRRRKGVIRLLRKLAKGRYIDPDAEDYDNDEDMFA